MSGSGIFEANLDARRRARTTAKRESVTVFVDMLIEIGIAVGANFVIDFAARVFWRGTISTATTAHVIIAMVGLLLGFISTMIWPYSMIRTEIGRILTVLLTPALLGGLAALIGWIVTWRRSPLKLDTFIGGAIYGGSFALIRYLLTTHTI